MQWLTCSMLRSTHLLDMITHNLRGGDVKVFVHLLRCSMLRSTCFLDMITHTFGRGGCEGLCALAQMFDAALHMFS